MFDSVSSTILTKLKYPLVQFDVSKLSGEIVELKFLQRVFYCLGETLPRFTITTFIIMESQYSIKTITFSINFFSKMSSNFCTTILYRFVMNVTGYIFKFFSLLWHRSRNRKVSQVRLIIIGRIYLCVCVLRIRPPMEHCNILYNFSRKNKTK